MPVKRREEIDEAFQDADDDEAHDHPFGDLGKEAAFDDAAEAEADDRDERGGYHRHPYRHTFAECHFIHTPLFLCLAPSVASGHPSGRLPEAGR